MKWISTKNQLPKNFQDVICTDGKYVYYGEYTSATSTFNESKFILCKGIGVVDPFDYYHKKIITHWMPMPKKPNK